MSFSRNFHSRLCKSTLRGVRSVSTILSGAVCLPSAVCVCGYACVTVEPCYSRVRHYVLKSFAHLTTNPHSLVALGRLLVARNNEGRSRPLPQRIFRKIGTHTVSLDPGNIESVTHSVIYQFSALV